MPSALLGMLGMFITAGAHLERGLPRDVESLHPRAQWRMHGRAKRMRELKNLLSRADHTEAHA
jgi:hypothetical protein